MNLRPSLTLNGVNIDQMKETVALINTNHELAKFKFRANTKWLGGARSRISIQNFYGAGKEDMSRAAPFVIEGDEPPVLLGSNTAPNAVEMVLAALTACLSVGFSYNAAARGIRIEEMGFDVEGDVDLCGFLGLDPTERPGYKDVRVSCRIKSDATPAALQELCDYVQKTSPVTDILRNPVPVTLTLHS